MSTDYGESWLVQAWNYNSSCTSSTLSGDGSFMYLLSGIYYNYVYYSWYQYQYILKLNISDNKSNFISSITPTSFSSIAVSYNGSLIVSAVDNDIYISSSFGSQWSAKSFSCNPTFYSISKTGQNMIVICASSTTSKSTNTSTFVNFIYTSSSYGSNWDQVASNNYTFFTPTYGGSSFFGLGNILMSESGKYILYNNFLTINTCENANGETCNPDDDEHQTGSEFSQAIIYISSSFGQSWYYFCILLF